ncbi:unnamed protein product [Nippostrongylus brasiliensis]|uniref:MR_MLE_N domain-containing protein n=1 Tax=Nippostrongylus brasiliensis TaxID=27835 RepID=A0A0N4XGK6_NIPBR|nr:unnamed protein product [Nippostrongylus brasiliensis]
MRVVSDPSNRYLGGPVRITNSADLCLWALFGVLDTMVKSVFQMAAEYGSYGTPENLHGRSFSEIGDPD